jgi:hypothetical protein
VKFKVVEEFVGFIRGNLNKQAITSQITDHKISVQIMSGVYCSHINAVEGKSPIISYKLD